VGIIETGVDPNHEQLLGSQFDSTILFPREPGIDAGPQASGHGSHVASTATGSQQLTPVQVFVEGVSRAPIFSVQCLGRGIGTGFTSEIVNAIALAFELGVRVFKPQLALDGAVIVTSPQRISKAAVCKVMVMAEEYRIPRFGIVANTLYGIEGEAGHRLAQQFQLPLLARLEWSQDILQGMEDHVPFPHAPFLPVAQALASQLLMEVLAIPEPIGGDGGYLTADPEPWTAFHDLSGQRWAVLLDLLPPRYRTGRTRVDDRALLNGILWVYTTRQTWSAIPPQYGKWATAKKPVERWKASGYWDPILAQCTEFGYVMTEGDFEQTNVDAGILRAGNQAGQAAWARGEGPAEVSGGEPPQRSDQDAAARPGDR
jgi:transposase